MAKFNVKDLSPKMDGKFYYGWVMLFIGFLFMTLPYVIKVNCTSLFYTPICEEFGVSRTVYAQTNTVMTVTMLIGSSFVGKLLNKFKLKHILPIFALVICVCYILMGQSNAMWQLLVLSGIQGFMWAGMTNLPVNIMVSNWFGPKIKGTAMSVAMLGSGLGALIWVPVMENIMTNYGWRTTYIAMAAVVAVMIPVTLFGCVNLPEDKGFKRRVGDPSQEEIDATGSVAITKRGVTGVQALKMPRWWCQFFAHVLVLLCNTGFTTQCVAYFSDLGMDNGAAIYAAALGTLIVGKFLIGFISDIINIKRVVVIAPILGALTYVCLALCSGNAAWSTGVIIFYMIAGSINTVPALITVRNFGDKDYGLMAGWMNMAGNIGQIVGPIIAAMVFDITGTYVKAWYVFAALMVLVAVLYYLSTVLNKKELKAAGYDPDI